ncbi:MAG: hypothetical protein RL323_1083 [Pseudomonadota bacterium]|jgi:hypothetical protein
MWLFIVSIKLIAEIALLALLGRWALARLLAAMGVLDRSQNLFYQLLDILTKPALALAAVCAPRWVLPRHQPLVAFALLAAVWLAAVAVKIDLCLQAGVSTCR